MTRTIWPVLLCATALILPTMAGAQVITPGDVLTVKNRKVNDSSPLGIRAGSFIISPGLEARTVYDDNVFRSQTNKKSDIIAEIKPVIAAQSDWNLHSVFFGAEGNFGTYKDSTRSDYTDYGLLASGRYDIAYETYFTAAVAQARRHQHGGAVLAPSDEGTLNYLIKSVQAGFTRALGIIKLDILARHETVDISNTATAGAMLGRTGDSIKTMLRYDTMPDNGPFVSMANNKMEYTLVSGARNHSDGVDLRGGYRFANAATIKAQIFGGYLHQSYDTGSSDTSKPYFGFNLNCNLTPLTTLTLGFDKAFEGTTVAGNAGAVRTTRRATLRHGFTTRLGGDITVGYDNADYVGSNTALDRKADIYYGSVGADYQVSDNLGLRLAADRRDRRSTLATDQFVDNRVTVSLVYMK